MSKTGVFVFNVFKEEGRRETEMEHEVESKDY